MTEREALLEKVAECARKYRDTPGSGGYYQTLSASLNALDAYDAEQATKKKITASVAELDALLGHHFQKPANRDSFWRIVLKACPELMDRLREPKAGT